MLSFPGMDILTPTPRRTRRALLRVGWLTAAIPIALALVSAGCGSTTHTVSSSPEPSSPVVTADKRTPTTAAEIAAQQTPAEIHKQEAEQRAAEKAAAHKKAAAEAKRKAKVRAWGEKQVRLLHQEEREGKIEKAIPPAQAEAEYNRRSAEGERKLKEMERRARGELTPEEQKNQEVSKNEASAEAEAIREGERLKSEGK